MAQRRKAPGELTKRDPSKRTQAKAYRLDATDLRRLSDLRADMADRTQQPVDTVDVVRALLRAATPPGEPAELPTPPAGADTDTNTTDRYSVSYRLNPADLRKLETLRAAVERHTRLTTERVDVLRLLIREAHRFRFPEKQGKPLALLPGTPLALPPKDSPPMNRKRTSA